MATANQMFYADSNFQSGDSPVIIDLKTDLGEISVRGSLLINLGPGPFLLSVSYDEGATFELDVFAPARFTIRDGILNDVDQIKITHVGIDTSYALLNVASLNNSEIIPFPDPKIFFAFNYFSSYLLEGASDDMSVDGLGASVEFLYTVPTDRQIRITEGILTLESGQLMDSPDFGDISALSNGVEIGVTPSGGSKVVFETWVNNRQIRSTMWKLNTTFKEDGQFFGYWSFKNILDGGALYLNEGDAFSFLIQDDLTNLAYMAFKIFGIIFDVS